MRVLVTAYGPFEQVTENVTGLVAPLLGYPYEVIEVSYQAVDAYLDNLDPESFDVLVSLGHDPRGERVRIETVGRNTICDRADVRGSVQGPGPIDPKLPGQLAASLWQSPDLQQETPQRCASTDAGGYLCNYILFGALMRFPEKRIGFLHLPPKEKMAPEAQVAEIREILEIVGVEAPSRLGPAVHGDASIA
ncbi:MAG: hypothetical protein HZC36_10950 [Armatimonadetes bacterium]|nr:hypothetical protein [Armatimonadota bacterium]